MHMQCRRRHPPRGALCPAFPDPRPRCDGARPVGWVAIDQEWIPWCTTTPTVSLSHRTLLPSLCVRIRVPTDLTLSRSGPLSPFASSVGSSIGLTRPMKFDLGERHGVSIDRIKQISQRQQNGQGETVEREAGADTTDGMKAFLGKLLDGNGLIGVADDFLGDHNLIRKLNHQQKGIHGPSAATLQPTQKNCSISTTGGALPFNHNTVSVASVAECTDELLSQLLSVY